VTAGSGFPAEWWTPPADVAMREQDPMGGALRLSGRVARFDRSTRGSAQAAGLRRRRKARRRMKPHRKDRVDGGRRETARAWVKIRGRGGSGEPNAPAIRPQRRLQGAPDFTGGRARRGQPAVRGGRRRWNLRRGRCFRRALGRWAHSRGTEPRGFVPLGFDSLAWLATAALGLGIRSCAFWRFVAPGSSSGSRSRDHVPGLGLG